MTTKKKHRFLLGALIGATAGVLLAPKSGKETRNDIKKGSKKAYRKARSAGAKTVSEAKKVGRTVSRDAKRPPSPLGLKRKNKKEPREAALFCCYNSIKSSFRYLIDTIYQPDFLVKLYSDSTHFSSIRAIIILCRRSNYHPFQPAKI